MPLVKLHDGRMVPHDSDEHRHECECRDILNTPGASEPQRLANRRRRIEGIRKRRGDAECERVKKTVYALWFKRSKNML